MPIPVTCPQCGLVLAAPDAAAGKKAKCRNCQTILTIPTPGLEILDDPAPPIAVPVPQPVAVPAPASFSFDDPPAKPRKRARDDEDDEEEEEEEERPRRKRRRDEDDDEDEKPRSSKPVKATKDKTLIYVIAAAFAVLFIVGLGGFGVWYAVIRKPTVETVDTSILTKPKPTVVVKTKSTGKAAPKDWEYVEDIDFVGFVPSTGKGFGLEKIDLPLPKNEEFPELGEARIIAKEFSRDVEGAVVVFSLRQESLKQVNKDPKRAIATWSDIFLIKIPADDVTTTDFTNTEYKYGGRQYSFKRESGRRYFYRMFVAHDKFYVLRIVGDEIGERNEYVKIFFDNFNPLK